MAERGSMAKEADAASKLERLVEQLDTLEPVLVARALQDMHDHGLPSTVQQAMQLRNHNAVSTLVVLLEPTYDVTLRSHALHVIARMCRLDRMCQDSFINHGAVRKVIKNSDPTLGREVDAPAAIRALACLVGGEDAGPSQLAAVEDVFLSGLIARMHGELAARRLKPDDLVSAIADFLSAVALCPTNHVRLRDAALLPLLPGLLEATFGGAGGGGGGGGGSAVAAAVGGAILNFVYLLSTSDAVAPSLRTELYFEALAGVLSAAPAMSVARRTALLTICNVFGPDADNVRAEEVLRVNGAPPLLTSLLAAALGPADVGAAAKATGAPAAVGGGAGGGLQRRSGGLGGLGAGGARGMRASDGGMLGRTRTSGSGTGGGGGGGGAAGESLSGGLPGGGGHQRLTDTSGGNWQDEGLAGTGGRKGTKNGFSLTSLTAPGFGGSGGGGGGGKGQRASGDGVSADSSPVPMEAILHSLKCMAANSMMARKLAKPGSPAYALPSLLDALVSSLQHATAGTITRAALAARASAGAQTLLRLACCAELVPLLRAAGVPAVLRMLAVEADDPRVGEAACVALLYMGDTGLMGYTSRPAAAAFRALYRNGTAPAGSEPELGNRFQVFVSHHRADSHQFAMFTLYPLLVLQGVPAFVDPQHRTASSDWAHMIACCRNMVVVVSEMLLGSPDHVREVEAAVAAGVNVVVVLPEGARWSDSHGNKTFDSPPPAVLLALPASVRPLLAENTMPYASARHVEFTQQLMSRLQLPAAQTGSAADSSAETASPSVSPGREVGRLRGGGGDGVGSISMARRGSTNGMEAGARVRGRSTGRGDTQGGDDQQPPHRVSFTGVGDAFQRLQQQQQDEEEREQQEAAAAASGPGSQTSLPWPWSKLLDGTITIGSDDEDEVVRYPRNLFHNPGGGAGGDQLSGTLGRESANGMAAAAPHTAAPPPTGGPASYTSRRFTARQRSSINRQAAQALQQQQQFLVVQHQWVQEFQAQQQRACAQQQQQQSILLGSMGSYSSPPPGQAVPADEGGGGGGGGGPVSARLAGLGLGGGLGDMAGLSPQLNQLLALQLELVRYELRQAVQASHDNIIYKIDRLRSDVTEQVVQLRFDLAGKLETIQETMSKAGSVGCASGVGSATDGASPREAVDAASGGGGGGSGGSNRDPVGGGASPSPSQQQQQHQQLAAALSTSLAATLQDAVNRAVAQLQASVAPAGVPMKGPPPTGAVSQAMMAPNATVIGGSPAPHPKGHHGAVAMLAAAAQQQQVQQQQAQAQQHSPHPPPQPSNYARGGNGGGGGISMLAPTTPHLPQGMDMLSPVARAGAAAWGADLLPPSGGVAPGPAHGGGAKSRSNHGPAGSGSGAAGGTGKAAGGSGGGGGGASAAAPAGPPVRQGHGPLAMFDAAAAEDEAAGGGGGGGGMDGRVMSPTSFLASVTSPATAQAALLLAGRTRTHGPAPPQGGGGGGGGSASGGTSQNNRNGSAHGAAATTAAVGGAGGGAGAPSKGTLPPLAGLLPSFGPMAAAKLVERTDAMPVRKAQQQQLLTQQQSSQHQFA